MAAASTAPPRRFSLAHLILIVPWVALVIDAWAPIRDTSFLWHVRAGTLQQSATEVIVSDPFSFTMSGADWRTQSWLTELLYAWGESVSNLGFVPPMILILGSVTFAGIGLIAFLHSKSVTATAFVMILSIILLISFIAPRPVLVSYALFVLVVLAWDRPGARWAVPLLFWIWASAHGSFIIGLAYVGLALLMRKEWRWLPTAVASGLVTLMTAHGLGVVEILVEFAGAQEALSFISEWRKPEYLSAVFLPLAGGVLFIVIGAFRGRIFPRHLWLLVPFLLLGLTSVRAVPPAWLGILPLVGLSLSGLEIGQRRVFSLPVAAGFAVFILVIPFALKGSGNLNEDLLPVAAKEHLEDVNTFHDDRAGGYLIWADGPDRQVFFDDRAELYKERMEEFVLVRNLDKDWRIVFERDGIGQALLGVDEELVGELQGAGWQSVYEDESYVILLP